MNVAPRTTENDRLSLDGKEELNGLEGLSLADAGRS